MRVFDRSQTTLFVLVMLGLVGILVIGLLSIGGLVVYTRLIAPSPAPTVLAATTPTSMPNGSPGASTVPARTPTETATQPELPTSTPTQTPIPMLTPTLVPSPTLAHLLYTVRAGDTLARIAARFNTTVHTLIVVNDLDNPDLIYVGQILLVPVGGEVPTPTSTLGPPSPALPIAATTTPEPTPIWKAPIHIEHPTQLLVGQRGHVKVQIPVAPDILELGACPASIDDVFPTREPSGDHTITTTSDLIAVYPVLSAQLKGDYFDITDGDEWDPRLMTDASPNAWEWDITPTDEDACNLRINLWGNDTLEEAGKFMFREIPVEIRVLPKPWYQAIGDAWAEEWASIVPTVIGSSCGSGGIVAILVAMITALKERKTLTQN